MEVPNYYKLLEVDPAAEIEAIEKAFHLQSAKYHPTNEKTGNPYKFKQVAEAWDILRKASSRERYDRQLRESTRDARSSGA